MLNRLAFAFIAIFWVTMNVLLWRTEFKGQNDLGTAVPAGMIWAKILTAPDDSTLEIWWREKKIGYCRWHANVREDSGASQGTSDEGQPDGMVKKSAGSVIDAEGNLLFAGKGNRLRFELHSSFTESNRWKDLMIRASAHPQALEIRASVASDGLQFAYSNGEEKWERTISSTELKNPVKLLGEFDLPFAENLIGPWASLMDSKNLSMGLQWEGRNDWLNIGRSKVRVYRLQAKLFEQWQIVVVVSRVGEILRVELPNDVALVNDALISL